MGALKVYDGNTWQTVAGQGPPGAGVPSGGATGQRLVKASATSFDTAWDGDNAFANWAGYTPRFSTDTGYEGGMTPGTGGYLYCWYRMIAPYAMALHLRFQWGSTGGNGGGSGGIAFSLPAGYSSEANAWAAHGLTTEAWTGDGFLYAGIADLNPNDIWLRPRVGWAGPTDRYIGNQGRLTTAGPPAMFPINWYPNGGVNIWGVVHTAQRW